MENSKLIVWLVFVLVLLWSMFLWTHLTPDETMEDRAKRTYFHCIVTTYEKGNDINNCNKIKLN